jgi:hypothetical protein
MDTNPATTDWKSLTDPQPHANHTTDVNSGEADPAWSPNGRSIVYLVGANIYVKPP